MDGSVPYDHDFRASSIVKGRTYIARSGVRPVTGISFPTRERAALNERLTRGLTPCGLVRSILLRVAGVTDFEVFDPPTSRRITKSVVLVAFPENERVALEAAMGGRIFQNWAREAVRAELGITLTKWTPCAEKYLRMNYRRADLAVILRALPGRTPVAVAVKARRMGLTTELGEERLSLFKAATRCGHAPRWLLSALHAAGKPVLTLASDSKRNSPSRRMRVVRWGDVLDVVRAEATTETPRGLAHRLGVPACRVDAALRRLGVERPKVKHAWRMPSEVAARVEAILPDMPTTPRAGTKFVRKQP